MDKIVFNDYDVTVEIYDSVIAKWMNTDYDETDPKSATYLRNRDKIQPKLIAGANITINPDTNEISAAIKLDQLSQLVSTDANNAVTLGKDGLLYVSLEGLDKKVDKYEAAVGTVVAYVAKGKEQGVVQVSDASADAGTIACRTANGTLVVNDPTNDNETVPKGFLTKAIDKVAGVQTLEEDFATIESGLVGAVTAKAIGNSQLLIQFTPMEDIVSDGSPVTIFSGLAESLLPSLGIRFGFVWDYSKVQQVGFCVIDADGDITVNATSTLSKGTQYTMLV